MVLWSRGGVVLWLGMIALLLFGWSCQGDSSSETPTTAQSPSVYYQIFVRSFYDSNGDGIGDLRGIISKLDYLDSLGINGIWLLPVHPSRSYHKYDVMDYRAIDPEYGTLDDFRLLLEEAHRRGMSILLDMVINHTDDEHYWFREALMDTNSPYRPYYVWREPDSNLQEPHLWHDQPADGRLANTTDSLFYGFFWKGMPDLNYDHAPVRQEVVEIARFWLEEMGVDGFRLDAALHIYPYYQEPQDIHLQQTVAWWQSYREALDEIRPYVYLVGEVWEGDSIVAPFLEKGLTACFNFDLSRQLTQVLLAEKDTIGLISDLVAQRGLYRQYNPNFQDAIFLSNHDQDRIRSVLGDDWARSRLAIAILMTLPGTPYLYYGEELGMLGKKPDEAIREPMVWDFPGEDSGQTRWQTVRHNTPKATPPLVTQREYDESLFASYQKWIRLRKAYAPLHRGILSPARDPSDPALLSFYRSLPGDTLWVVHNLSAQPRQLSFSGESWVYLNGEKPPEGKVQLAPFFSAILRPSAEN